MTEEKILSEAVKSFYDRGVAYGFTLEELQQKARKEPPKTFENKLATSGTFTEIDFDGKGDFKFYYFKTTVPDEKISVSALQKILFLGKKEEATFRKQSETSKIPNAYVLTGGKTINPNCMVSVEELIDMLTGKRYHATQIEGLQTGYMEGGWKTEEAARNSLVSYRTFKVDVV